MRCEKSRARLVAFLLGEVSGRESSRIADHLRECPACLVELDSLSLTTRLLQHLPDEEVSPALQRRLAERLSVLRETAGYALRLSGAGSPFPRRRLLLGGGLAAMIGLLSAAVLLRPALLNRPPGSASPTAAPLGRIVRFTGQPRIRQPGREAWALCSEQTTLTAGAALATAETDRLEFEAADGTRIGLDFDTSVELVATDAATAAARPMELRLRRGRVWLLVTPAQAGMVVHTAAANAQALGTLFSVSVEPVLLGPGESAGPQPEPTARTTVTVLRGKVQLSNQHGVITVEEGAQAEVTSGRPPGSPHPLEHLETTRLQAPWGQTVFQVWVPRRLELGEALGRVAGVRGLLGVKVTPTPMTPDGRPMAGPGASVVAVTPGLAAQRAGIRPGDLLRRIGDVQVFGQADVVRSELLFSPRQRLELLINRAGRDLALTATLEPGGVSPPAPERKGLAEANRLLAAGMTEEAGERYRAMARTEETSALLLNNLGLVHELGDEVESALSLYREAVTLDLKVPLYRFNLAMAFSQIGNLRSAAEQMAAALAIDPAFPDARYTLGRLRAFLGEYGAAAEQARLLESVPASRSQGHCLRGEILRLQGDTDRSEAYYLMAAEADRFQIDPPTYLGAVYLTQGKLDAAQGWIDRALRLDPKSLRALNTLGLILLRRGDYERAKAVLLEAAAAHPGSGDVRNNLGYVYLKLGDLPAATSAYREAVALAPDAVFCHVGLAAALETSDEPAEAKQEYAAAIRLDPTYEDAYRRLAALHRKLGERQLAQEVLDTARRYGL